MIIFFLKKFRIINLLFSWLTILCVAFLCNEIVSSKLIYVFLLASCFLMASNILNDLLDIKTDEIKIPSALCAKPTYIYNSLQKK